MKRRDVLKILGWTGLSCVGPWGGSAFRHVLAQPPAPGVYDGPFWILLHAGGGWDPTSLCDPKGRANENEDDPVNRYLRGDIRQAGNIRYAPVEGMEVFFERYASQLTVLNGLDTGTNGHDQGVRGTWSGQTGEGYPSMGALVAAANGPELPLSFINSGGYGEAQGIVRPVRLGEAANVLRDIANPNIINSREPDGTYIDSPGAYDALLQARERRLERQLDSANLPRIKEARNKLYLARSGESEMKRINEFLPEELNDNQRFSQVQVALASYMAGTSACVSIGMGGFDTHSNHDDQHLPRLVEFLGIADFAMQEAERLGVADKVILVMGSDFGRTPRYNGGNGKDHWPISSMMMMGPGIEGNRVIGATDEKHGALLIDPETLAVTGKPGEAEGVKLTIGHVHRAIRRFAGVPEEYQREYPIGAEDLPIFGELPEEEPESEEDPLEDPPPTTDV